MNNPTKGPPMTSDNGIDRVKTVQLLREQMAEVEEATGELIQIRNDSQKRMNTALQRLNLAQSKATTLALLLAQSELRP